MHAALADAELNVPAEQSEHVWLEANLPAPHEAQAVAAEADTLPLEHDVQVLAPLTSLNVPAEHGEQAVFALPALK